jgi:ATP-binding cassette subfamily G (WHITE) protein 2 (SNQ2)
MYMIGYGQGAAGLRDTGFQLLVVIFVELFGVSLGQVLGAL